MIELNGLHTWSTDVGNTYLESFTREKVYIIAGPEFGDRQEHTLAVVKALYGLKSSGLRWRERFADEMGFTSSKAEPDIWMRDKGDHYKYIAVYVDNLLIASREPDKIVCILEEIHMFNKLKGSGPTSFHLGCDFWRDEDGVLCYAPKKYIMRMLDTYERLFGKQPKQYVAPLQGGDHPQLDDSELLEIDDIKVYQSLMGALQWVIQIGRFDITISVMTLSRFRAVP
jgi:Reverse transcriptase (RNA-dependent DNA polymerase)